MNSKFFLLGIIFHSLCVCESVSAQEKTPVALAPQAKHSVATNPVSQNWEVSVGLQGLSFYSDQETPQELTKNPFKGYRTRLGIAASATKWFSPEIALRTKVSGLWAKSIVGEDKNLNAIRYLYLHEDVMVNLSNIIYDYDSKRKWDCIPYTGVGMTRNFTHKVNAMILSLGMVGSYRIADRLKVFGDLSFHMASDEFDNKGYTNPSIFKNHDRWLAAEIGVTFELGQNRWKRVPEMDDIEVVPWEETQRELKRVRRKADNLQAEVEYLENQTKELAEATTVISTTPEISIFFEIGSANLNHRGQLENIRELVETAKRENRTVIVTGYADSSTGNSRFNEKLSAKRADTIAKELVDMGVSEEKIKKVIGGGVDTLNPVPANRRVTVCLE